VVNVGANILAGMHLYGRTPRQPDRCLRGDRFANVRQAAEDLDRVEKIFRFGDKFNRIQNHQKIIN
jgi:hypothetical protein